ncbi:peroxisomal biogenesis factor 19 isoform X2 [Cataglyphis hispanica]|uniref:peroxisomal biogenesis factor 19 isoform X2 n=1 Tax=Cataglyphis hispanica TaxID=1086592 RepID=UPI0021805ABD|nr:peroxisomal biogenesis factor 19 isoform X2 [Cataglyphis hispanica]
MTDNTRQSKNEAEDEELNVLLDSALKDFGKEAISNIEKDTTIDSNTLDLQNQPGKCDTSETCVEKWTEDFLKQTADQFEKNLQNLLQNEAALQKLGETSANDATNEKDNISADFQSAISQVLKDLTTNSENLQNDTDLAAMLGRTSLDSDTGDILPFMQGMMEHLLSKEILYPSLKELSDKYPAWLEEHRTTMNSSDLQRYTKQLELMQKVCLELEKENKDDTEDIKKRRFESILKLMTEMQNYGQAPEDLVGEQCSLFQFDSEGNPVLPLPSGIDSQQDCSIM